MKNITILMLLAAVCIGGCYGASETPRAVVTGLQARTANSHDFGRVSPVTYENVWWATISSLQLNGFVLRQADINSGYVYGVWRHASIDVGAYPYGLDSDLRKIEVSVTLRKLTDSKTRVRISGDFGPDGRPIHPAEFSKRFFGAIQKELFLQEKVPN